MTNPRLINPDSERRVRDPPIRPSFSDLAASLVDKNPITGADRDRDLEAIRSMRYVDEADVEKAIDYCRLLLLSLHPADELTPHIALKFGRLSWRVAKRTNDTKHLNNSITAFRDLLNTPSARWMQFDAIKGLLLALFHRLRLLKDTRDAHEMMRLYAVAVSDPSAPVRERFKVAFHWTWIARRFGHPSLTEALEVPSH